jgi:hypothetical protein
MINIIQILKAGNQELFYSSFIAWLLDAHGAHGLSDQFSSWFFQRVGEKPDAACSIQPEVRINSGRADIFIVTNNGRKLIIENKTKSIGTNDQLNAYKGDADKVIPLGFVAENFPAQQRDSVVTYKEIIECLKPMQKSNGALSVLVDHFISFLELALGPFDTLRDFCNGIIGLDEARQRQDKFRQLSTNSNDHRFFQAVYFEQLRTYMSKYAPFLIFGDLEYHNSKKDIQKPSATKWIVEKNMQGPAFMEAIIYSQNVPGKMKLNERWAAAHRESSRPDLCPRLELWVGPDTFLSQKHCGVFQLGCWNDIMKSLFHSSGMFKKRGSRNFHHRTLSLADLQYANMTKIVYEEMSKVWDFEITPPAPSGDQEQGVLHA